MRKTKKQKNTMCELTVVGLLVALLTACSSGETMEITSEPAEKEISVAEASEEAESVETADGETSGAEEAAKTEATDAVVKEAVGKEEANDEDETEEEVDEYAQIDMESTLPGVEWIQTFDGVIEEPKFVIFNDETNKKVIVENGQEVEFCDTDVFAVFFPLGKSIVRAPLDDNITFCKNSTEKNIHFYNDLFPTIKNGDKILIKQKLEVDGEALELSATLVISGR